MRFQITKCDFVMFPELFNAPLMAAFNHLRLTESIRRLAEYTEQIRDKFIELAITYNINIITGSMPFFLLMKACIILVFFMPS